MYLELVKQVSQVEQETEASVRQAAQQAQQMQEEAERSGRALVEQTRRDLQQLETQRRRQAAEDAGGSLHLCRSGGVPVFWRRLRRRCRLFPWERPSHSVSGRLAWQSRPVRVFSFPSRRPPT